MAYDKLISISNLPSDYRNSSPSLFDKADEIIVRTCENTHDIIAVYDYGTRSHPGISDLDMIFICSTTPKNPSGLQQNLQKLASDLDKIGARNDATIMVFDRYFLEHLLLIDTPNIKPLYGEVLPISELDNSRQNMRDVTNLIEWIQWNQFKYAQMLFSPSQSAGGVFRFIKCLAYTLENIDRYLSGSSPTHSDHVGDAKSLRDAWLRGDIDNAFLAEQAHKHIHAIVHQAKGVAEKFSLEYFNVSELNEIPANISFQKNTTEQVRNFLNQQTLPSVFMAPWSYYATQNSSALAQSIKLAMSNKLVYCPTISTTYQSYLKDRLELIEHHLHYLKLYLPKMGAFKMGWFRH